MKYYIIRNTHARAYTRTSRDSRLHRSVTPTFCATLFGRTHEVLPRIIGLWIKEKRGIPKNTSLVRRMRLELTRSCDHYPLKVACIPISPPALAFASLVHVWKPRSQRKYSGAPLFPKIKIFGSPNNRGTTLCACAQNRTRTCTPRGMRT